MNLTEAEAASGPPMVVISCPACGGEGCHYEWRPLGDDPSFEVGISCAECGGRGLIEVDPADTNAERVTEDDLDEIEARETEYWNGALGAPGRRVG